MVPPRTALYGTPSCWRSLEGRGPARSRRKSRCLHRKPRPGLRRQERSSEVQVRPTVERRWRTVRQRASRASASPSLVGQQARQSLAGRYRLSMGESARVSTDLQRARGPIAGSVQLEFPQRDLERIPVLSSSCVEQREPRICRCEREQVGNLDAETPRNPREHRDRRHSLPGLDLRQKAFVQVRVPGQSLLRDLHLRPQSAHPRTELARESCTAGKPRHGATVGQGRALLVGTVPTVVRVDGGRSRPWG